MRIGEKVAEIKPLSEDEVALVNGGIGCLVLVGAAVITGVVTAIVNFGMNSSCSEQEESTCPAEEQK